MEQELLRIFLKCNRLVGLKHVLLLLPLFCVPSNFLNYNFVLKKLQRYISSFRVYGNPFVLLFCIIPRYTEGWMDVMWQTSLASKHPCNSIMEILRTIRARLPCVWIFLRTASLWHFFVGSCCWLGFLQSLWFYHETSWLSGSWPIVSNIPIEFVCIWLNCS